MDGCDKVLEAYARYQSWWLRFLVIKKWRFCRKGKGTKDEEYINLKKMYFFKKWPNIELAGNPGNVHWTNIGVPSFERKIRISLSGITAFLALFVTLMLLATGKKTIGSL